MVGASSGSSSSPGSGVTRTAAAIARSGGGSMTSSILRARLWSFSRAPNRSAATAPVTASSAAASSQRDDHGGGEAAESAGCVGHAGISGRGDRRKDARPGRAATRAGPRSRPKRSGGLRLAAAATGQLAGRQVDGAAADGHVRAGLVGGDRPLYGGAHRRDLFGGIELDGEDVLVAASAAPRALRISSSRWRAASWRGDNARSFGFLGASSSIFAARIRMMRLTFPDV